MFAKGDSCYSRHYFPSGQLRLYCIEAGEDFTSLVYSEAYYSNGQLLAKLDYGPKDLELSTSYWPNGNKQSKYLWSPWGGGTIVGDYHVWHENGQLHIKGQFTQCTFAQLNDRSCESKEQGTWTYWFEDGRVEKIINYKDGVEVK